jgi:beta-phosphoglucomutase
MITSNICAVIFDLDGVIVDNMKYHRAAWEKFLLKYAPGIEIDAFSRHFGKRNEVLLKMVFKRSLLPEEVKKYGDEKEFLYRELYAEDIETVSGLIGFLKVLRKDQIKIAVASAAPPENVDFVLDKTGIREFFNVILSADDVKRGKPDPEIYLKTAHKLACSPRSCLVFEDSIPGIQAAKNAGMKVAALTTTYPPAEFKDADLIINDFTGIEMDMVHRIKV